MKKQLITSLVSAFALVTGLAQSGNPEPATQSTPGVTAAPSAANSKQDTATAKKPAGFPFRGTLKAVDKEGSTLTIGGKEKDRVIHLLPETKYTKDGKAATLADALVNGEVAGYARKGAADRTEALSVRFGAAVKEEKPARKSKVKKSGEAEMPAE